MKAAQNKVLNFFEAAGFDCIFLTDKKFVVKGVTDFVFEKNRVGEMTIDVRPLDAKTQVKLEEENAETTFISKNYSEIDALVLAL